MESVFWFCFTALAYIYVGYPLIMAACAAISPRPVEKGDSTDPFSVVIVAFNEAERLPAKIRSLLASSVSDRICEIVVASDGSTDETESAVLQIPDPRVRFISFPARRGKAAVLNDVVPRCGCDFVVLTDARQEVAPGALGLLLSNFCDESVGAVSGELVLRGAPGSTPGGTAGFGAYWTYEKFIRRQEGRFRSVPGATGALYVIRKSLFPVLPEDILLDDVFIPMQIISRGYRCVFEPDALVIDALLPGVADENVRKRRTIAGNLQLVKYRPEWLLPWRNRIWFEFMSHKMLRLVSPYLLLGLLASNAALARAPAYAVFLLVQMLFYVAALWGYALQRKGRSALAVALPLAFVSLNITTVSAWYDACRGAFDPKWRRIARK